MSTPASPVASMWLVGFLYNNNGMGTWCWEAAHALADAGESVTLVCSESVALPGPTAIPVLRIALPTRADSRWGKMIGECRRLSSDGRPVMYEAVQQLAREGVAVGVVLSNATEFLDERIEALQVVTAWARGVTLGQYLARVRIHQRGLSRQSVRAVADALGWWRKDWRGYRGADLVLAVSGPLAHELQAHGVAAALVHPCTHAGEPPDARGVATTRLLIAAADLDEPRKRVAWMLDALRELPAEACTLTLVGSASDALRERARTLPIPVQFTGLLPRDKVLRSMRDHDVLLFGSLLDDWGYVITEAMTQGLAVIAPRMQPFDEIIDDPSMTYDPQSMDALLRTVANVLPRVDAARTASWNRARAAFSRALFVDRVRAAVEATRSRARRHAS